MSDDLPKTPATAAATPTATDVLARAGEVLPRVGRAVLCQIVGASGSTPGKVGWKLLVTPGGEAYGNLGGGAFEALVRVDATGKLGAAGGDPAGASEVKRYYFTEKAVRGEPTGMVCGGLAEVFLEVLAAPPVLVVCGGGPVGQAVARAADLAGFDLVVVEDREEFRAADAFPPGTAICDAGRDFRGQPFLSRAGDRELAGRDLYVTVVSRCWQTDTAALAAVLDQVGAPAPETSQPETAAHEARPRLAYLGLMGSRRKVARVRGELERRGHDLSGVDLRAPIGLPLGGDSPGEIAISILAEVLQTRHRTGAAEVPATGAESEAADPESVDPSSPDNPAVREVLPA